MYLVKINDSWHYFLNASILKGLIIDVANYTGIYSDLFEMALKGCGKDHYIEMYNAFANSGYDYIQGIWKLDSHIYGDKD